MPRWPPASAISSASRAAASGRSVGVEQLEREPARVVRLRLDREAAGAVTNSVRQASRAPSATPLRPASSSRSPVSAALAASSRAERCRNAVATMLWSAVGSGRGGTPGSSHSPKWNPLSHRNSSCGAGLGTRRRAIRMPRPGRRAGGVLDPLPHRRQPLAQGIEVAVVAPELPRHEHRGIPPPGGSGGHVLEHDARRTVAGRIRDDGRHAAVGPLVGGEVVEPLRRERLDVVEHRGGVDEDLPVAGEAGALALRAVRRDVARVAPAGSAGRARAGRSGARRSQANSPDRPKVAVHDDGARGRGIPSRRNAVDLHVAEPVRRVPRLEDIARRARARSTSSTCPAGRRSPVAKTNARRFSIETSPSASSTSPCVSVRWVSRGPRSSRRSQPLMLRPTSITTVPSRGRVTATGASVSMRRTRTADASTSRSRSS